MTTWTPVTQQSETWTNIPQQSLHPFSPYGFSRSPRYATGTTSGVWDEKAVEDEIWTPET